MASISLAPPSPGSPSPPPPGGPLRPEELLFEDDGSDDGSLSESELPPWLELESPSRFKPSSPTVWGSHALIGAPASRPDVVPALFVPGELDVVFRADLRVLERDILMMGMFGLDWGIGGGPGGVEVPYGFLSAG